MKAIKTTTWTLELSDEECDMLFNIAGFHEIIAAEYVDKIEPLAEDDVQEFLRELRGELAL